MNFATMLFVVGMVHGVPSVATHDFKDSLTCTTVAADVRKKENVMAAFCALPLVNIPKGDKLTCCTDH